MEKGFDSELLKFITKKNYFDFCKRNNFTCPYNISQREIDLLLSDLKGKDLQKYLNKASSIQMRKWRLKLRIDYMVNNFKCLFVTFTLNNKALENSFDYLRKSITRLLKSMNCFYVGNVDYGSENERLHFHFLVASDDSFYLKENYKFGFVDIEPIYNKNSYKLSNYIDKITNHALKDSTKDRYSLITSRGDYAFTNILNFYRLCDKK